MLTYIMLIKVRYRDGCNLANYHGHCNVTVHCCIGYGGYGGYVGRFVWQQVLSMVATMGISAEHTAV
jgi:hypothetical protein